MKALLTLADVVKPLPFKTHQVNLWWNVYSIIKDNRRIDFDVYLPTKGINLQRPFCWNLQQNQQLILSVIHERYIPKMCVLAGYRNDSQKLDTRLAAYEYQIIDGKQRLNARLCFLRGEFPITFDGVDYFIGDMDINLQNRVKRYSPQCEVAYFDNTVTITDDAKIAWFEQINFSGTPQDEQHMLTLKGHLI